MSEALEKLNDLGERLEEVTVKMAAFEERFELAEMKDMPQITRELTSLETEAIFIVQEILQLEAVDASA